MGTVVSFDVPLSARHDGSLEAAVRWLHWVDRVFSPYRPDSDVSKLARAEVTLGGCAPEVAEVFAACASVRDVSGGYFTASPGGQLDPSGYVNGGGDVQCAGGRAAGEPWRVGIADPFRQAALALVVAVSDCAVATSGTAERGPHIIDPFTGRPPSGLASLTVIGPSLSLADAYATAAFAMGPARARDWTSSLDGYEAYAITSAGDSWQTPGFTRYIAG